MKIVDYSHKKVKWWNRNYFWAGTIFLIILQISLCAIFGFGWSLKLFDFNASYGTFSIQNFFNGILGSFDHSGGWPHLLLNMLCFLGCGLYLERKMGTIKFIPFVLALCIFSRMANMLVLQFNNSFLYGFSSCNYALYGFIILDVICSFNETKKNKFELLWSIFILALIYLASCWINEMSTFTFYPYDFIYNSWHWSGFLVGIIVYLMLFIQKILIKKEERDKL